MVDDDGRRTAYHGHPISSPCEPNGSGELITVWPFGISENVQREVVWANLRTFGY